MDIAIITAGVLPVPSTKGGAVETLISQFIEQNEIQKAFKITIYSIEEPEAKQKSKNYRYTKFEFININPIVDKIYKLYCRGIRKIFNLELEKESLFIKEVVRKIKKQNFEKIIIENNSQFVRFFKSDHPEIYLHLHNDYLNINTKNGEKIADKCKKIITVSEFIKNRVETIPNVYGKVSVIKNCTDLNLFNKNNYLNIRDEQRNKFMIDNQDTVILYSGRISETKGVKELLEAFKGLTNKRNVKLLIVGSTWYSKNITDEYLEKLIEISEEIKEKIIFTGYVNYSDLHKIHAAADIAIVPSIWDEPAGLVLLEAMASGLPLITTDVGGILEYINIDGALVVKKDSMIINNLEKALSELILDHSSRIKMGEKNQNYVRKFSTEKYYSDFCRLLKK